jgi:hypothetical protein
MTIHDRIIDRYQLLPLLLAFSFLVSACGQSAQPTATMAPTPTSAQPTPTMTLPPTPAPPTATMTPPPTAGPASTSMPEVDLDVELPEGDSERGHSRAIQFRCAVCHIQGAFGPRFETAGGLPSILERGELRIADPAYEGSASTNREYIIESVLLPEVYVIPGEWVEKMPTDYADSLTEQDLADIMAWLGTFE